LISQHIFTLPIEFEIFKYHQSKESITVEFGFKAKQIGAFGDIPATGKQIEFPVVGIYTFDVGGKLVQENITFDTAAIVRQLSA